MATASFGCAHDEKVLERAKVIAEAAGRGLANIEDQLSAALALYAGLEILQDPHAMAWKTAIDSVFRKLIEDVLSTERGIREKLDDSPSTGEPSAGEIPVSFLMSFASRAASRERLNIFTTNYDRVVERGCDLAGLRIVDRFVGALQPEFRASRLQLDMHYTPPGVRGEPRHLEGVVHLTKLHGSLDWRFERPCLFRSALPFGADASHPGVPANPRKSVIIYPNAAKDMETVAYPYADLFRDYSAAICRSNHVLVTYGYGFGDDHINRVIFDMLTIPSTHLVMICWSRKPHDRAASFISRAGRPQQLTLLVGTHFGNLTELVHHYLPKPAIDPLTIRMVELLDRRGRLSEKVEGEDGTSS